MMAMNSQQLQELLNYMKIKILNRIFQNDSIPSYAAVNLEEPDVKRFLKGSNALPEKMIRLRLLWIMKDNKHWFVGLHIY